MILVPVRIAKGPMRCGDICENKPPKILNSCGNGKKYGRTAARYEKETKTLNAKHVRRMKRYEVHQDIVNDANIKYVNDNRKVIESGQHWSCLVRFAQLTLLSPEKIVREFGNEKLVRTALGTR